MSAFTLPIYRMILPNFFRGKVLVKEPESSILKDYTPLPESPDEELFSKFNDLETNLIAITPYHLNNQEDKEFKALLSQIIFGATHYYGFMLFYYNKKILTPCLDVA